VWCGMSEQCFGVEWLAVEIHAEGRPELAERALLRRRDPAGA
jgi:hypothetical protein